MISIYLTNEIRNNINQKGMKMFLYYYMRTIEDVPIVIEIQQKKPHPYEQPHPQDSLKDRESYNTY